jgi:hypothetical protein
MNEGLEKHKLYQIVFETISPFFPGFMGPSQLFKIQHMSIEITNKILKAQNPKADIIENTLDALNAPIIMETD